MGTFLSTLFGNGPFDPHGECFLWIPGLIWLHVLSDGAIAAAYFSIPVTLWYFTRKRPDFAYGGALRLFATFILACGATHVMDVWTIWHGSYWLDGWLRAATAGISVATAIYIVPLVPRALAGPTMAELAWTQQELRESEERFARFIGNFPGMAILKEDGRYVFMNEVATGTMGYPPDGWFGRPADDLATPERAAAIAQRDAEVLRTNETLSYVDEFNQADGTHYWFEQRFPVPRSDGTTQIGVVAIDITDRKLAEEALAEARDQALEASRLKSKFVSTVTHELRTPLSAIIGTSELLHALPDLGDRARAYANTIDASAEALLSLINGILDFSKIEAGALELDEGDIDLEALIEATSDVVVESVHAKGVAFHTYVDPLVPTSLRGDRQRLTQILLNLVGNAVKFTEHGSIVVRALPHESTSEHITLRFEVQDTGIGIAPEGLASLFDPFTQADGSASRPFGGTGLGLSISKRLVELMHGEIGVSTHPGQGSLFWFTARFRRVGSIPRRRSLTGLRTLIISQDDIFAQIVMRYAASWSVATWHVKTAEEARATLRDNAGRGFPLQMAIVDDDPHSLAAFQAVEHDCTPPLVQIGVGTATELRKPLRPSNLFDRIAACAGTGGRAEPAVRAPASEEQLPEQSARAAILVVEDNEVISSVLTQQLAALGYACTVATNGSEALKALGRQPYALVFMDCQMPEMDGLTATRRLREAEAESGQHVPVVAMTANAFKEDRERCLDAGMDDYLAKPVRLADLRAMADRWLRKGEEAS